MVNLVLERQERQERKFMTQVDPNWLIKTKAALREVIPNPHPDLEFKKVSAIEPHSYNFIKHSPFVAITTRQPDGTAANVARAAQPGFIQIVDSKTLLLPDYPANRVGALGKNLEANPFIGLLFIIPGIKETVRLNGRARLLRDETSLTSVSANLPGLEGEKPEAIIAVDIEELFLHCPKAFVRSRLWDAGTWRTDFSLEDSSVSSNLTEIDNTARSFIEAAPFLMLGTMQTDGKADISPRGDPPGFVKVLNSKTLLIPDRPGNRLADNYNNILSNPYAGLLFLIPGVNAALRVSGKAQLTNDPALLALLTVQEKTPQIAIWLEVSEVSLEYPQAFERAQLWNEAAQVNPKELASAGEMLLSHLRSSGLAIEITPQEVDASLEQDAKENLY